MEWQSPCASCCAITFANRRRTGTINRQSRRLINLIKLAIDPHLTYRTFSILNHAHTPSLSRGLAPTLARSPLLCGRVIIPFDRAHSVNPHHASIFAGGLVAYPRPRTVTCGNAQGRHRAPGRRRTSTGGRVLAATGGAIFSCRAGASHIRRTRVRFEVGHPRSAAIHAARRRSSFGA